MVDEIKKDKSPLDDVVDLKENGESVGQSLMFVAVVRHLMSPFLLVFFCFFYAMFSLCGLYLAYLGKLDIKDTFTLILAFIGNTLTMMVSYRFAKGSAMDKPKA